MRHRTQLILGIFMSIFFIQNLRSQVSCGTNTVMGEAFQQHPGLAGQHEQIMAAVRDMAPLQEGQDAAPKVIPVVFHVIHNYGAENITEAQIQDAIAGLNEDFQLLNADTSAVVPAFQSIKGKVNFEFRLAKKDPNGNCTNGITRTVSPLTENARENVKSLISWPRDKYLNIWIVRSIANFSGTAGIIAGYAYLPGSAPSPAVDGVVLDYRYTGGIGAAGGSNFARRTISHEVGHWFGLQHPWGSNDNCGGSCDNTNDGINDTPTTSGSCSTCNLTQVTCGSLDNVQNIMDYATCANMFTKLQASLMNQVIVSATAGRNNLWTNANRVATGTQDGFTPTPCTPVADFTSNSLAACQGASVQFTDFSWNVNPTAWNWTFSNGTTQLTSTQQNPQITFTDTGLYQVTLTASSAGGQNSVTRTNFIRIYQGTQASQNWFYADGFDQSPIGSGRWFPTWSAFPANGWKESTTLGATAPGCVMVPNFGAPTGRVYNLISPAYDLTTINGPVFMYWKRAFARRNNNSNEQLRVMVSTNCGQGWSLRKTIEAADLATRINTNLAFVPTANDWRTDSLTNLLAWEGQTHVQFRFEFTSSGGNNFYLDDLNITGPLSMDEAEGPSDLAWDISPNPASGPVTMRFWLSSATEVSFQVLDLAGRLVFSLPTESLDAGWQAVAMKQSPPSPGMYFIQMQAGNRTFTQRIVWP